jgi:hypothetical protein
MESKRVFSVSSSAKTGTEEKRKTNSKAVAAIFLNISKPSFILLFLARPKKILKAKSNDREASSPQ